jgi:non-heme chloroperoxidase
VVFVHGLWLLPASWDRWVTLFEEAGYVGVTPGWPDDPETVAEARKHPEVFAGKGIGEIAD